MSLLIGESLFTFSLISISTSSHLSAKKSILNRPFAGSSNMAGCLVCNGARTQAFQSHCVSILKGLGQAILGNFSTDRMVIELTKISK